MISKLLNSQHESFVYILCEISLMQSNYANKYQSEFEIIWSCRMINVSISNLEKYTYIHMRSIQNMDNTTQSCTAQQYIFSVQVNDITFLLFS